jgi:hypothetical protein
VQLLSVVDPPYHTAFYCLVSIFPFTVVASSLPRKVYVAVMPPPARPIARALQSDLPSQEFRDQFNHPAEVFSVLLILGGDVVARALAQLAGGRLTPVTFSFGIRCTEPVLASTDH